MGDWRLQGLCGGGRTHSRRICRPAREAVRVGGGSWQLHGPLGASAPWCSFLPGYGAPAGEPARTRSRSCWAWPHACLAGSPPRRPEACVALAGGAGAEASRPWVRGLTFLVGSPFWNKVLELQAPNWLFSFPTLNKKVLPLLKMGFLADSPRCFQGTQVLGEGCNYFVPKGKRRPIILSLLWELRPHPTSRLLAPSLPPPPGRAPRAWEGRGARWGAGRRGRGSGYAVPRRLMGCLQLLFRAPGAWGEGTSPGGGRERGASRQVPLPLVRCLAWQKSPVCPGFHGFHAPPAPNTRPWPHPTSAPLARTQTQRPRALGEGPALHPRGGVLQAAPLLRCYPVCCLAILQGHWSPHNSGAVLQDKGRTTRQSNQ